MLRPFALALMLLAGIPAHAARDGDDSALQGRLEAHITLQVGDLPPVQGQFDTRQLDPEKVSSVQYLEFHLGAEHREAWAAAGAKSQVSLVSTHPAYSYQQALNPGQLEALAVDFQV